jgi:hypothetical protein
LAGKQNNRKNSNGGSGSSKEKPAKVKNKDFEARLVKLQKELVKLSCGLSTKG